jgi:hypothetical protein
VRIGAVAAANALLPKLTLGVLIESGKHGSDDPCVVWVDHRSSASCCPPWPADNPRGQVPTIKVGPRRAAKTGGAYYLDVTERSPARCPVFDAPDEGIDATTRAVLTIQVPRAGRGETETKRAASRQHGAGRRDPPELKADGLLEQAGILGVIVGALIVAALVYFVFGDRIGLRSAGRNIRSAGCTRDKVMTEPRYRSQRYRQLSLDTPSRDPRSNLRSLRPAAAGSNSKLTRTPPV